MAGDTGSALWPCPATPGSAGIFLDGDTPFLRGLPDSGEEVILRLPGGSETDYRRHGAHSPGAPGLRICPGHGGALYSHRKGGSRCGAEHACCNTSPIPRPGRRSGRFTPDCSPG